MTIPEDRVELPMAGVKRRRRIPLVWIVPLLTGLIGLWLAWDTFSKRGPTITIQFETADGLTAGQSQLKYKNVVMGTVQSIAVAPDFAIDDFDISADGTIQQNGQTIGKLDVADFSSGLAKQGSNYFRTVDPSVKPAAPAGTTVERGKLESSNTGPAESAIRLVNIMRQFEMLQKAASIGNDMSKQAIEQVAKVGS